MDRPPTTVKLVMQGVCILLGVHPIAHRVPEEFGYVYSYWEAAVGREVLGHPHFQDVICSYDRARVTEEIMAELEEQVVRNAEFCETKVRHASKAAAGMFLWVCAIRRHFYAMRESAPNREALARAQEQLAKKEALIENLRKDIVELSAHQETLAAECTRAQAEADELAAAIEDCE